MNKKAIGKAVWAAIIVVIIVIAGIGLYLLNPFNPPTSVQNPGIFIDAQSDDPVWFDPAHSHLMHEKMYMPNVYESLLFYDQQDPTTLVPLLATTVPTVENGLISADGLQYTFPIREGVKFHNGEELTGYDIEYSIERVCTMQLPDSESWMLIDPLTGWSTDPEVIDNAVEVINDYRVRFNLLIPDAPFLYRLVSAFGGMILNKNWVIENGGWDPTGDMNWTHKSDPWVEKNMMGTGPYKLTSWVPGERLDFEAFEDYWQGPPKLKEVIVLTVRELSTRLMMLKAGDVDSCAVSMDQLDAIKALEPDGVLSESPHSYDMSQFSLNFEINVDLQPAETYGITEDWFHDIHLRRAFSYAMDREKLNQAFYNGSARGANSYLPKGILGWDVDVPGYQYDLEKAEEEFRKAWGGEVWENGFRFTIWCVDDETGVAAQIFKEGIEACNPKFHIDVTVPPYAVWLAKMGDRSMAIFASWWPSFILDPYLQTHFQVVSTGMGASIWKYKNQTIDDLAAQAIQTIDPTVRAELYSQIQWLEYYDASSVHTVQMPHLFAYRSWLKGWHYAPGLLGGLYWYWLDKG